MLSLLISLGIGGAISWACFSAGIKSGSIAYGILGFVASQLLIGLLVRRSIKKVNAELQALLEAGQKRITHKINQFQMKPGGNPSLIQKQLERDQHELFKSALAFTERLEPFRKWNPLMPKQLATLRFQFLYQLNEFEQVDAILAKGAFTGPFLSDPMLVAMKMARQYQRKDVAGAEKTFKRHARWYRDDRGALLYGVMSWIFVKQERIEEARKLLAKAKEKMYNEVIAHNWEMLSNNRAKAFSNAGFGDPWYSLYLEKPLAPKRQQVRMQGRGRRPF